jgi:hypothetical protein
MTGASLSRLPLILLLFCLAIEGNAQVTKFESTIPDSVMEKEHSPTKATVMSALLPGLGQIYNRKYWKVPIIWAGFGVFTYFIVTNSQQYIIYKGAYIESVDSIQNGKYSDLVSKYSSTDLLNGREYYRRNLEITCILTAVWYLLNIIDATVDAHLFTYNISKDLSLKLEPVVTGPVYNLRGSTGIRLSLKF